MKNITGNLLTLGLLAVTSLAPLSADQHRQNMKNQWRNLSIGSAAVGLYGLVKGDTFLTVAGIAGAAYSANRYEQDRKSQSADDRRRAAIFKRGYYYSHGHKYVKHTFYSGGKKYYKFVRAT
ncbi:MAG: hypothetical protein JSS72_12505 [Armatimonadetes bacterium]|nr:hypothetical protein [Armatimonadota bacterium]